MRFETFSTMTVIGEDISPPDAQLQSHPHLAAAIKWWVSCVWGVAGLLLRRLLRVPPSLPALRALPALPSLGRMRSLLAPNPGAPPSPYPSPAEPEPSVTCCVLCDPPDANVDVIFVHGLYGSLVNTWKQGQWRSKHKTGPKRIPIKRHVSLPENNFVNDLNNNAKIHKEPRLKKKSKSEEYCSCDNKYYKINLKKQSDISNKNKNNTNNNIKIVSKNNTNPITNNKTVKVYSLQPFSRKELTKRRQTVPSIISGRNSRTEMIETSHIENIFEEIMKNPEVLDIKLDEILNKEVLDFLEKFLSLSNNDDDLMKIIYERCISIKDIHKERITRKSILNMDFNNMNEEYKSLGEDLNHICDRIEYFISKFNSPPLTSEVGYKNVCDLEYDCENEGICHIPTEINDNIEFNSQIINNNDVLNIKSEFNFNNVAIGMNKSAFNVENIDSESVFCDCDKVVSDSFEELDNNDMKIFEDLPNFSTKIKCESDGEEMENRHLKSYEQLNGEFLDKPIGNQKYSETRTETTNLKNKLDKEKYIGMNQDVNGENAETTQDFDQHCQSNVILHDEKSTTMEIKLHPEDKIAKNVSKTNCPIQESIDCDQNNREKCQKMEWSEAKEEDVGGLSYENDRGEVSDDSFGEKSCEVGCGCVCRKCYSSCWPRDWLKADCPQARVIAVNYTSDPYLWRPIWIKEQKRTGLQQRADEMVQQLLDLGVGQKPIVWVGHSKGGLFIKQIYTDAYESYCASKKDMKESNPNADQSEHILPKNKCPGTNEIDEVDLEELTNDNFSVRLETELNDESVKNGSKLEESFSETLNAMVLSGVKDDLSYGKTVEYDDNYIYDDKSKLILHEKIIGFEDSEIMGEIDTNVPFKGDDENRDIFDEIGDFLVENEEMEENGRFSNPNLEDRGEKQTFNQSFEATPTNFDEYHNMNETENERDITFESEVFNGKSKEASEAPDKICLWSNTKGFMFYSVPHRGSPLAGIRSPLFARSVELLEISENCASVLSLQGAWLCAVRAARGVLVRSFVETARTLMAVLWLRIVSVESAVPSIPNKLWHANLGSHGVERKWLNHKVTTPFQ